MGTQIAIQFNSIEWKAKCNDPGQAETQKIVKRAPKPLEVSSLYYQMTLTIKQTCEFPVFMFITTFSNHSGNAFKHQPVQL